MTIIVPKLTSLHRAAHAFLADLPVSKITGTDVSLHQRIAPALTTDQWAVVAASVAAGSRHWTLRSGTWRRLKSPRGAPRSVDISGLHAAAQAAFAD